ncbi:P-loop containing nucleoside triphosphate hydrolase protein [Tuber borchii]|uniref:P-loop containing nucleoside triphosphate hydrolase protein n=1 Tax=Tuber borchii TaxID=42251 RepID=A0A2T6ZN47_TUBBO|nr:P-loop containing nucleoside triphosphate hydrolase protein [Tuber borchii]
MPATSPTPHTVLPPYLPTGPPLPSDIVPLRDDQEREVIIAVMGVTGTGKSYFIREVSGISNVEVSSSLHSCTAEVQSYSFPYAGVKITLVDTPGFSDTTKSDTEVLTDICAWMSLNYREGKLLSGIIYLHRITDVRMDGTSLKNFKMLQKMCGPEALQNVFLTTTQWSNVNPALGAEREENLRHKDFWGELISQGASLEKFEGTGESGLELIYKLMEKEPKPLSIQCQMVEKGMALVETDAGKFINDELISVQKKYEKDVEDLERERQNAIEEKDNEMEVIMELEKANAQEKLQKVAAERKLLTELYQVEMRKHEEAERERGEERERSDRAVIAVDSNDIPHRPKGRLIRDTDDPREFESEPFDVTIEHKSNIPIISNSMIKRLEGLIWSPHTVASRDYIIYNQAFYRCKPNSLIKIGNREFIIFTKY